MAERDIRYKRSEKPVCSGISNTQLGADGSICRKHRLSHNTTLPASQPLSSIKNTPNQCYNPAHARGGRHILTCVCTDAGGSKRRIYCQLESDGDTMETL